MYLIWTQINTIIVYLEKHPMITGMKYPFAARIDAIIAIEPGSSGTYKSISCDIAILLF